MPYRAPACHAGGFAAKNMDLRSVKARPSENKQVPLLSRVTPAFKTMDEKSDRRWSATKAPTLGPAPLPADAVVTLAPTPASAVSPARPPSLHRCGAFDQPAMGLARWQSRSSPPSPSRVSGVDIRTERQLA